MKLEQTTEPTIELSPELQVALHSAISQCVGINEQIELLKTMLDDEKTAMMTLLQDAGINKASHDGYHVAIVTGTSSTLDKRKLVALGVSEAMIAAATTTRPKKPYVMLRKAGENDGATD